MLVAIFEVEPKRQRWHDMRDYGMFERREAPQYYPEIKAPGGCVTGARAGAGAQLPKPGHGTSPLTGGQLRVRTPCWLAGAHAAERRPQSSRVAILAPSTSDLSLAHMIVG
jgi:hypothetical protein